MPKRNLLTDVGLGAWAVFLPLIMTLGTLGEGHYGLSAGCAILSLVIIGASLQLLRTGSSKNRKVLIMLSGVLPVGASVGSLIFGGLAGTAVWAVFAAVAIGVGILLKKAAEW